jgi:hypothetical protein
MECTYTIDAIVEATITTDSIKGDIEYVPQTNKKPDCETIGIEGCVTKQKVDGTH